MRLLAVLPFLPFGDRSGTTAIMQHQLQWLAERHLLDLVSFDAGNGAGASEFLGLCREYALIKPMRRWEGNLRKALSLFGGRVPFQVLSYRSGKMSRKVRELLCSRYDAVLFFLPEMAQYYPSGSTTPGIWYMEDPQSLKFDRAQQLFRWHHPVVARERIKRFRSYERKLGPVFSRVLLLNRADAEDFSRLVPGAEVDWVPYGIDAYRYSAPPLSRREPGAVVISGNMHHPPNADGVIHFADEVMPLVVRRHRNAKLYVVGSRPPTSVARLAARGYVQVTGDVPSIATYIQRARVSVCPVRLAIGTQTKVLEAMACGTPVVTTPAGNRGVGGKSGVHLYVDDDPAEMAAHVVALLEGEGWDAFSSRGREFVLDNFGWEKSGTRLERIIGDVSRQNQDVVKES